MCKLLSAWIKDQVKAHEQWIDHLHETSQDEYIPFYAGVRQGLLDVLEQIGGDNASCAVGVEREEYQ